MSKIDDWVREGLREHQSGNPAAARTLYLRALARQPSHPAANHLLGVLLIQSGEAAAAVPHLERAVRLNRSADTLTSLGTALNATGRHAEALAAFDAALAIGPANPGLHNNRGMALRALRRQDDAVAAYRAAIALLPAEAGFHRNLGNALADLGEYHAAEAAYREALARRPGFGNAATGLANALLALGRPAEAVAELAALAARHPGTAEIHRAHGHALWRSGDAAGAAAAWRRAIAADIRDVEAHRMLGLVVCRDSVDAEVAALDSLLADPGLTARQRIELEFARALADEDMGQGDRALAGWHAANARQRALMPFDTAAAVAHLDSVANAFAGLSVPPLAPPTGPVFILGLPRSGKSTLEGKLARHPALFAAGELATLPNVAAALADHGDPVAPRPEAAAAIGARYRAIAARLAPGRRVVDTQPDALALVGLIRAALPEARVLLCRREPVAQAAALFTKFFPQAGKGYSNDPEDLVSYIAAAGRLADAALAAFPGFVAAVPPAAVTGGDPPDSRSALAAVFAHIGLDPVPESAAPFVSEPRLGLSPQRIEAGRAPLLAELRARHAAGGHRA